MPIIELFAELGCNVNTDTVTFTVEPVLFKRALGLHLRSHPQALDDFIQEIQDYTEDPQLFRKFMLPSQVDENVPRTNRSSITESLFKNLLAVDSIQSDLITYLLERLPEFYDELEQDNSSSCTARLILHQLRWLDYIAQPETLTSKLIEIIQITPSVIQHEMITSLPDIINDSEHKPVVVFLKELMNDNSDLTVPILDTLSNLTLHSESLEDVRQSVLDRLESAELEDLPIIVKFLLQTSTSSNIDFVIYGIRQKVDFRSLGKIQQQRQNNDSNGQTPEALILESIKLGLQFHKYVCDSWLKSIVALETQRDHKIIDVMVLIILYSMTSTKKKTEGIIKKKMTHGSLSESLIQETIMQHPTSLSGYWGNILSLSESLLRSCHQDNAISPYASAIYISAFKSTDTYFRQEIIGALATHIGSGVETEMNVALNVLLELVKADVSSVIPYSVFVKGTLDYLDNLDVHQIRTLFDIFSLLALTTGTAADGSANLWSEIQVIVRKQLSNPREKYKCIGIIASLSAVKVLGSRELCERHDQEVAGGSGGSGASQQVLSQSALLQSALRHPMLRQATALLDTALRSSKEYPNCISLIYDELAQLFIEEEMDERLELWVKENMTSDFTEFYVISAADADAYIRQVRNEQQLKLEPKRQMGIDNESEISLKMYKLIQDDPHIKRKKAKVVPMCSIFNLLQSCEKRLNKGSLAEVDALFGCSIVLFDTENLDDLSTEETENACDMLFYTINWFKELLNAFMFYTEEENYQINLIARLRSILYMEDLLAKLMQQVPNYVPLEFQNTANTSALDFSRDSQIIRSSSSSYHDIADGVSSQHTKLGSLSRGSSVRFDSVASIRSYSRAFNIHIMEILRYNQELESEQDKLTYQEINFILQDINHKLDIKIVAPPTVFFGKKKQTSEDKQPSSNSVMLASMDARRVASNIVAYLNPLLETLENLYAEMQEKNIEPGYIQGSEELVECVTNIFEVMFKLISWSGIQMQENRDILKDVIVTIASRVSGKRKPSTTIEQADIEHAFRYLSNYIDGIPKATTAVLLFKLLLRFKAVCTDDANGMPLRQYASKVINQIVVTPWFDWRDIKKEIPFLFEQSIELSEDPLTVLHDIVNVVLPQFQEEQSLAQYPLLKEETIVQHYQAIFSQTVKAFDLLKGTDEDDEDVILVQTGHIVKIFERITNYVKQSESRVLMGILLKTGRLFIDRFTKHSIPYFTKIFKPHSSSIVGIFKDFQTSTRMLQIICSHVKVLKDISLSAHVPPLKKALEIVIYQVKMLLTENRVPSSAFFMGALKHRDIRGAEISSQIPREQSEDEEEEEEAEENDIGEEEMDLDGSSAEQESSSTTTKRKRQQAKKNASKPRANKKGPEVSYRSSSLIPSSEDEEEEEEEPKKVATKGKRKYRQIADDDESEEEEEDTKSIVLELDLDDDDEDDEDEDNEKEENILPSSKSPSPSPPPPPAKKKRLGLGKYKAPSNRPFNLSK